MLYIEKNDAKVKILFVFLRNFLKIQLDGTFLY